VQVPDVLEHAPDQPEKSQPTAGAAVKVTDVPDAYGFWHPAPPEEVQLTPPESEVTVPDP